MFEAQQGNLFGSDSASSFLNTEPKEKSSTVESIRRIDADPELSNYLLQFCRLRHGQVWEDPIRGHRVGVLNAVERQEIGCLMCGDKATLAISDPPYNITAGTRGSINMPKVNLEDYMSFTKAWVANTVSFMGENSHFYCWIGADYRDNFQPLPDFMVLMREFTSLQPKNFITLRNQRGYGTKKNWMWVRQELLHYVIGNPSFHVVYTDIPKILRGYYKEVGGKLTENLERGKSDTIRPGNVWVDVQQVFYRMEENVPGCYAQKPLKAIERIIASSSEEQDAILDTFAHSGTTLLAGERLNRRVFTCDYSPIFAELTIRRLERYRSSGKTGWQWRNPFPEMDC